MFNVALLYFWNFYIGKLVYLWVDAIFCFEMCFFIHKFKHVCVFEPVYLAFDKLCITEPIFTSGNLYVFEPVSLAFEDYCVSSQSVFSSVTDPVSM